MYYRYAVTGATGFLGRTVISKLTSMGADVTALVLKGDPYEKYLPDGVSVVYGDVSEAASLVKFTEAVDHRTCLIHCAGIVSVASRPAAGLFSVNVDGTKNILDICIKRRIAKFVYVSSVHAIPHKPQGIEISEPEAVSPELVHGEYARSKAMATDLVIDAALKGLNASIVYPSGIIGPGDIAMGSMTSMLLSYIKGKLRFAVPGGYDFVDVRDVAHGIISCADHGENGQGYILSGQYITVMDMLNIVKEKYALKSRVHCLSEKIAGPLSSLYEKYCLKHDKPLFLTPYAVSVLNSNAQFQKYKAMTHLSYRPRPLRVSIEDTINWLLNMY